MRRAATVGLLLVVAVAAAAAQRELDLGRSEVAGADAASARGAWAEAIAHARSAAEARFPGSPWPEQGLRRLEAIGRDAGARGDRDSALLAYGAMRTAALVTRGPGSGSARWLSTAEDGLARLAGAPGDAPPSGAAGGSMLDALRREPGPGSWTSSALALSVLATLAGLGRLACSGPGSRGVRAAQALAVGGLVTYAVVLLVT